MDQYKKPVSTMCPNYCFSNAHSSIEGDPLAVVATLRFSPRTHAYRDEVFSILVQQLNGNPTPSSRALGWVLLCCCLGCCTPSERVSTVALYSFFVCLLGYSTGFQPKQDTCTSTLPHPLFPSNIQWPSNEMEASFFKIEAPLALFARLHNAHVMTVHVKKNCRVASLEYGMFLIPVNTPRTSTPPSTSLFLYSPELYWVSCDFLTKGFARMA